MRPRVFPAEDARGPPGGRASAGASMRPRVFPAEDRPRPADTPRTARCFNEAAGIPRGRLDPRLDVRDDRAASMRPRVFPAEDGLEETTAALIEVLQ